MSTKRRRPLQKALFVVALISYLAALVCVVAAIYLNSGTQEPWVASLMASVVFFTGVGVVLHVIARTDLPDLKLDK